MSSSRYFIEYDAIVWNDHLEVQFQRLYRDVRDVMCDSLKPQWEPEDKFWVHLAKTLRTTTTDIKEDEILGKVKIERNDFATLDTLEFQIDSKQAANYIWWLAKHGATFDQIKAMHEAKKF